VVKEVNTKDDFWFKGGYPARFVSRDESGSDRIGSDRIISLPHLYTYFFCQMWSGADITRMRLRMRFFRMPDMVRSRIGCGADAD
jgi:hypothetical protein